ncbi:hypothetical protein D3C72_2202470 [compost metagenome]
MRCGRIARQLQHGGGGIDAIEAPAGMGLGQRAQFQPATGTQHQDAAIARHALCQQERHHAMEARKARHLPWRAFDIGRRSMGAKGVGFHGLNLSD